MKSQCLPSCRLLEKPVLSAASHSTSLKASLIASYPSVVHSSARRATIFSKHGFTRANGRFLTGKSG
jgi:hypothetical protein